MPPQSTVQANGIQLETHHDKEKSAPTGSTEHSPEESGDETNKQQHVASIMQSKSPKSTRFSDIVSLKSHASALKQNALPEDSSRQSRSDSLNETLKTHKPLCIKIFKLTDSAKNDATPLTSIQLEGAASAWTRRRLRDLRPRLHNIKESFQFCEDDGATVTDDRTLWSYLNALETPLSDTTSTFRMYISCTEIEQVPKTAKEVFANPPFLLKFVQILDGDEIKNGGSLHSSSLQGNNPASMTMNQIRKMIRAMSQDPSKHEFCSNDGTTIPDDVLLEEYVGMSDALTDNDHTPIIQITFRKVGTKSRFNEVDEKAAQRLQDMNINGEFKDRGNWEIKRDTTEFRAQDHETLNADSFGATSGEILKFTSDMDEDDWAKVIRNCNLMFGWRVDPNSHHIVRAPKAAFRLREGVNMPKPPAPVPRLLPLKKAKKDPRKKFLDHLDAKYQIAFESFSDEDSNPDGLTDSDQTDEERDNDTDDDDEDEKKDKDEDSDDERNYRQLASGNEPADEDTERPKLLPPGPLPTTDKPQAFPSFLVNDNSKIEITTVSHEFQASMAENHFSSTSVEISASGGYAGFSAAASASVGVESSNSTTNTQSGFQKTMVGKYQFPRVTVYLTPDDLVPTEELQQAIQVIRNEKSVDDLRKLYDMFGNIFCGQVTLGGCLKTTKIVSGTSTSTESEQKEKFKAAVGLSVQAPGGVAGGGVKAEHEQGSTNSQGSKSSNVSESLSFEATGGNTILAANPASWSASVGDFNNWRIIDQTDLSPLADTLSQIPGYDEVFQWFLSAAPTLSKYIRIPSNRRLDFRLKVSNDQDGISRIAGKKKRIHSYLIHDCQMPVWPRRMAAEMTQTEHGQIRQEAGFLIHDVTTYTKQVDTVIDQALFSPSRTQAPVIFHYEDNYFGGVLEEKFDHSIWRFEVPEGRHLQHNTKVTIKSHAVSKVGNEKKKLFHALTVYRNQQGAFLPAMTSSTEPSYWRILKLSAQSEKEDIKDGDPIRLAWCFSDQQGGYRDFLNDAFGRRRFTSPSSDFPDKLYLKCPYPRFERTSSIEGMGLVMSTASISEPVMEKLKVLTTQDEPGEETEVTYNLHDLLFRLDSVGHNGLGEANDYMTYDLKMDETKKMENVKMESETHREFTSPPIPIPEILSVPMAVISNALFGPVSPVGAILGAVFSLFD